MARRTGLVIAPLLIFVLFGLAGCGNGGGAQGSYKPTFLPFKISYSPGSGMVVTGDKSVVTPLGEFSIGAKYSLPRRPADAIRVVLRDRSVGFDEVYDLGGHAGEFEATLDGTTKVQVRDRTVTIDVTQVETRSIEFRPAQAAAQEAPPNLLNKGIDRWNGYWDDAFYSPLALSRWAYGDSTMGKWYGLGFVWFLIRLVLALILGILDIVLVLVCVFAACFYVFFGGTGRNIAYGLSCLFGCLAFYSVRVLR
ncbi:hypothetical protein SAMN05443665_102114 [Actinomadura meyerae]|uniref:Lipoprotein n=1 Tax=Actinomadura meyerae TaxID=240840 RepID=A0A239L4K8_9ACTN|nr:hypothetical protein [Actinomadura meyerae]SNT25537.1 hypothetical protein SAMN05443665_102114 [Actinomadura meyerae]